MPDDTITLISTTDSAEDVQAALTGIPRSEAPAADDTPADDQAPAAPPADETPEQADAREAREASEAGSALAKRKAKIQRDIDEHIRRKNDVRRDVEAEELRLYELRRQREELETVGRPAAAAPAPAAAPAEAAAVSSLGRPEPKIEATDAEGNGKYATYEDYLTDHAAWAREEAMLAARKVIDEEKHAERARIERDSTARVVNERLATFNTHLETFKKTHADFDATFEEARDTVQETLARIGPTALKVIDGYTVFDAQDGPALMYHLLKHPDELTAIAVKPPAQQIVHLARLDERLRSPVPAAGAALKRSGPSAAAVLDTKAPEPIRPVGSGPTATTVSPDEESYQDYKTRRNRELRVRQGLAS